MEDITKLSVGQIVSHNFITWKVFENYNIDYYNRGKQSLNEAAKEKNIEINTLIADLKNIIAEETNANEDYNAWPLDVLADYIQNTYHKNAEKQIQLLKPEIEKICTEYGGHYPGLKEIKQLFDKAAGEIAVHQKKEELILFPFIKRMADAKKNNKEFVRPPLTKSISNPVDMLTHEHQNQGEALSRIRELTKGYTYLGNIGDTYTKLMQTLREFEENLHQHIHLENNLLFPKALKLEKEI